MFFRPKVLTICLCLLATPALAGKDGTISGGAHLDKETRDFNRSIDLSAKHYGEPDGSGGWIGGTKNGSRESYTVDEEGNITSTDPGPGGKK